jgi:hypothetical protein
MLGALLSYLLSAVTILQQTSCAMPRVVNGWGSLLLSTIFLSKSEAELDIGQA